MEKPAQSDPDARSFDAIYASRRGQDPRSVPWAHGEPHPLLAAWLRAQPAPKGGARALVVGSGLGDDAEALATTGWEVTAFDVSPEAVAWARERFPDSAVDYQVASLFELPEAWREAFDLVVEIHTVQSLPVTRRQDAIGRIAATVAPGGTLFVVAMTRDVRVPLRGRPWLLTDTELASYMRHGLHATETIVDAVPSATHPGRARALFIRPDRLA